MWQIDNRTPFAAERAWVRDRSGAEIWLVAVKATFDIRPDGSTDISADQPKVLWSPEHYGEPGQSSVKYDADLVLTKTTTDVIVVGHAYAPPGRMVTEIDAGFSIGPIHKLVRVFGDRSWGWAGMSSPQPFAKMPLVYERAYGGHDARTAATTPSWDRRNPVGIGFATSRQSANAVRLPNIEDPQKLIRSWDDRPSPAGLGAIANHWLPRADLAGTYDEHWQKTRQPLLAADLDDRYFQCAPTDQQTPTFLRGGEPVELRQLTPNGLCRFLLPKIHLGFRTFFSDGTRTLHPPRKLHTVILEPDYPRVSLVFHSALPCHFKVHKLLRTLVTQKRVLRADRPLADEEADDDTLDEASDG